MESFLTLPERTAKPRQHGITALIDNGYPLHYFEDVITSFTPLIDYVKFGWGTAYVTDIFEEKLAILNKHGIKAFFGGSFFEKAYFQGKLDEFCKMVEGYGINTMEISNGTIPISNTEKAKAIKQLSGRFEIFSEVGHKDSDRSEELTVKQWIDYIQEDFDAGASYVITETREGGSSGVCNPDGSLKADLMDEIFNAGFDNDRLILEAPNKSLQVYFVKKLGANVNLANIPFNDVIALETLRTGLRGDTLTFFENQTGVTA